MSIKEVMPNTPLEAIDAILQFYARASDIAPTDLRDVVEGYKVAVSFAAQRAQMEEVDAALADQGADAVPFKLVR